jgi:translation initiation factor IF-1
MKGEEAIVLEGTIRSVLAGTMFRVELPSKHLVLAHISGPMRNVSPDDRRLGKARDVAV